MRKNWTSVLGMLKKYSSILRNVLVNMWKIWADALGIKADENDNKHSDRVAIVRTMIVFVYLITNIFIVANIIKHW